MQGLQRTENITMDNVVQPTKTNEKKMQFDLTVLKTKPCYKQHDRQTGIIFVLRIFSSFTANNMNYVVFHKSHMLL